MNNQKNVKKQRIPKEINLQIGKRCRHAREAGGYTQERLAEQIGVSTQFLSDAERGITGMSISTSHIFSIYVAFKLSICGF